MLRRVPPAVVRAAGAYALLASVSSFSTMASTAKTAVARAVVTGRADGSASARDGVMADAATAEASASIWANTRAGRPKGSRIRGGVHQATGRRAMARPAKTGGIHSKGMGRTTRPAARAAVRPAWVRNP
jgi:hypothetical protein